ncbi:MAG: glycosyltransferase family 4 protein [Candidatus Hodarchaeota archaeon]
MGKQIKRICYVNPGINVKRPISFLMNKLKNKRYNITLLLPKKKYDTKREKTRYYDDFKGINLLSYPIWTKSSGFIWPIPINLDFIRKCWKALKENDIIHIWTAFYPNTLITCLLKLLFFKKKTLILTMDTFPAYSFNVSPILNTLFKLYFKTIGKIAFFASNYISIYGNSFFKYAKKAGISRRKIIVTPTGIESVTKSPDKNIRETFSINSNEKIVLYVGLHNKRKGIDLIIKTANLLKNENIKFILVGDGPERLNSINKVSKLGLSNNVLFTGTRLDIHNFYNQADVFFLPSRGEGLAGVLMEAMIYQVPIVTSNIAGTRDLIKHLENGLLCKTENYLCYAMAIKKLLYNDNLRSKFKENGLKKIKSEFLWKDNLRNFEKLYKYSKN